MVKFRIKSLLLILLFNLQTVFSNTAHVITVGGAITPATAKFILDHVQSAEEENAVCLIIKLDTPGGLLDATLDIDKKFLASKVPVIVYISPRGGI